MFQAVSNDELYGIINPATREWKDGLFSCIMRDIANLQGEGPKWILLDGDIDPMWIESLNTVMDDNKILTLASNERLLFPNKKTSSVLSLLKNCGHTGDEVDLRDLQLAHGHTCHSQPSRQQRVFEKKKIY